MLLKWKIYTWEKICIFRTTRARVTSDEFIDKLYLVNGYKKQYKRLVVTYRYQLKRMHNVADNDQKMMKMAFILVTPSRN